MSNEKEYRYISLEGCKKLGEGKHGRVYRLNDEQIVKTYYDDTALEEIELERRNGRMAFVRGVPSCLRSPYGKGGAVRICLFKNLLCGEL